MDIMIETHAMLNYRIAVKMAERLAKLDITWYEDRQVLKSRRLTYYANYINTFIFSYVQKASGTSLKGIDFTSSGTALGRVTSVWQCQCLDL